MLKHIVLALLLPLAFSQNCYGGCFECDQSSNVCTACYDGYQLTLLGNCVVQKIDNCNLYADSQTCLRCLPTYKLISNACIRDYSGCISKPADGKCAKCSSELTLSFHACVGVLNCQIYSSNQCFSCSAGFSLVGGRCVAQPDNCLATNFANGVCLQCRDPYRLSGYKCISKMLFSTNCELQDDAGHCQQCKDGYVNRAGSCFGKVEALMITPLQQNATDLGENTSNAFVEAQKSDQEKSSGGTAIVVNITAQEAPVQANSMPKSSLSLILSKLGIYCKAFSSPDVCKQCYAGFYIISGYCLPIDPYCKSFNAAKKTCDQCFQGYTLNANYRCAIAESPPRDPNCKTFQGQDCLTCYPTYYLKLGGCIPNNPLCKNSALDGSCESCYQGYLLDERDCVVDTSRNPNIFDPFCIRINGTDCTLCANGYFVNENGTCSALSLNCLNHDPNGTCLECLAGFVLFSSNCLQAVEKCLDYSGEGCSECAKGYFLKRGLCYQLDETCSFYDANGTCLECVATYYLINGQCVYPSLGFDPLCASYVNSFCTSCRKGSFLANYRCMAIDSNCMSFDPAKFRCLRCANAMKPHGIGCA